MRTHGMLVTTPGVSLYNLSRKQLESCRSDHMNEKGDGHAWREWSVGGTKLNAIQPQLAWEHERAHNVQTFSTDFGFACWQLDVMIIDVALRRPNSDSAPRRRLVRLGRRSQPVESGLELLVAFRSALQGRRRLTMGQFLDLANSAHAAVAEYWGLPARRWVSAIPRDEAYLPPFCPTGGEVLEGGARMVELLSLVTAPGPLPGGLFKEWKDASLFGEYFPAPSALLNRIGDPYVSTLLADVSLLGNIALHPGCEQEIFVENSMPGWRFEILIREAEQTSFPVDRKELHACVQQDLPQTAGLKNSEVGAETLAAWETVTAPGGCTHWMLDDSYRTYCCRRYARLLLRHHHGWYPMLHDGANVAQRKTGSDLRQDQEQAIQPLLEFYPDFCSINMKLATDDSDVLMRCFGELVRSVVGSDVVYSTALTPIFRSRAEFFAKSLHTFGIEPDGDLVNFDHIAEILRADTESWVLE